MWGLYSLLILSSAAISVATSSNSDKENNNDTPFFAGPESDDEYVAEIIAVPEQKNYNVDGVLVEDIDGDGSANLSSVRGDSNDTEAYMIKQVSNPLDDTTASAGGGAQSSSQPLRTLKRLQAMLEDSDYVTQSVAASSLSMPSSSSSMINSASATTPAVATSKKSDDNQKHNERGNSTASTSNEPTTPTLPEAIDKLWTYKDRAKYRATARSSNSSSRSTGAKQQQQQHRQQSDDERSARTRRNLERQQIVQEERERKREFTLLVNQHNVNEEFRPQQIQQHQQQASLNTEEGTEITDDDTDDAYGYYSKKSSMGFELPNLPIHLSDGENTEDDEEEEENNNNDSQIVSGSSSSSLGDRKIYEEQQQPQPQQQQPNQQLQGYPRVMQQQKMTHIPPPPLGAAVGSIMNQSPYYNTPQAQAWQQQSSPSFHVSNSKANNYQSSQQQQQQYPQYHHQMPQQQQQQPQQHQPQPLQPHQQKPHHHQEQQQEMPLLPPMPHQQPHQQEQQIQQTMSLSPPYQYSHNPPWQRNQPQLQYNQEQYAAWAAAAAAAATNGYYYPGMSPPSSTSPYQTMPQQQQQKQQQHQSHQFPFVTNPHPQLQNQGLAPYANLDQQHINHPSHLQQQQHQGGPYSHVLPEQQGGSLYRSQFNTPLQLQQQQQQQYSESIYYQDGDNIVGEQLQQNQLGLSLTNDMNNRRVMEWPTSQQQQPQHHPYYNTPVYETERVRDSDYNNETMPISTMQDDLTANAASISTTRNESMTILRGKRRMGINSVLTSPWSKVSTPSGTNSDVLDTTSLTTTVDNTPRQLLSLSNADELVEQEVYISGANTKLTVDSIQRISFIGLSMALLSYFAVSPRSLPFPEYNSLFLQNFSTVGIGTLVPIITFLAVFDGRYNNINTVIGTCHIAFSLGYALTLILEIIVTTTVRLGVFRIWEPSIFSLTPSVPSIILPWVLREKQYKPKRITLFAADFCASCVASPIIEEYMKLKVVQWSCKLPRNFKKTYNQRGGRNNHSLQQVRNIDAAQVTNINCYVTQMLAASIGMKLFDVTRRILMYTKDTNMHKRTYALCRGTFPIHELCGTMTALMLARRDVLGVNLPQWQILGPAVFIHGMANFRGMKPIFKWNSSTPWSEMQLSQLTSGGGTNQIWKELLPKSYAKLVWLTILCRVYGFCVKNYYLIGRQAIKRTTTYSGKLHAFNAKLQTDAMLKKIKSD
jgi:hypothetical protein